MEMNKAIFQRNIFGLLTGQDKVRRTIEKTNRKLRLLFRKNWFSTPSLRQLLGNAIIQPHFDHACSAWYPKTQKEASSYAKQMSSLLSSIGQNVYNINWLPVIIRFESCFNRVKIYQW